MRGFSYRSLAAQRCRRIDRRLICGCSCSFCIAAVFLLHNNSLRFHHHQHHRDGTVAAAPPTSHDLDRDDHEWTTNPPSFSLGTALGRVQFIYRMTNESVVAAPKAVRWIQALRQKEGQRRRRALRSGESPCKQCRFYRAEPVPAHWGDSALPDSSFGGRWGPPYALLQGSFGGPVATNSSRAEADRNSEARPSLLKRGHVAWAGGGGGNDFFIALADHPEWGSSHTVFAAVPEGPGGLSVLDALVRDAPKIVRAPDRPGRPQVTNLQAPVVFEF